MINTLALSFTIALLWSAGISGLSVSIMKLNISPGVALHRRLFAAMGGDLLNCSNYFGEDSPFFPTFRLTSSQFFEARKGPRYYLPGFSLNVIALGIGSFLLSVLQLLMLGLAMTLVLIAAVYDLVAIFLILVLCALTCFNFRDPNHPISSYRFRWFKRKAGERELYQFPSVYDSL